MVEWSAGGTTRHYRGFELTVVKEPLGTLVKINSDSLGVPIKVLVSDRGTISDRRALELGVEWLQARGY